ncbi:MAG: heavy metal translocating P-type ATPase metal-binding domain-containing protein, partial [Verrucomicrobiota bacterium]
MVATLTEVRAAGDFSPAAACFHCGSGCAGAEFRRGEQVFCCLGCQTVHELLMENGLGQFYQLGSGPGSRVGGPVVAGSHAFLDQPGVREKFIEFSDGQQDRVTFRFPAIHCLACVWLLENLHRLHPGVGRVTVHFPRREATIQFDPARITLGGVASLVASLGYEPDLRLGDLGRRPAPVSRRLWLQLAVAGFAFGNTMLFSLPGYFGLDADSGPAFRQLTGLLSLGLALPVVGFSALDYWRSAGRAVRLRRMNLEVPIALGIAALFGQ